MRSQLFLKILNRLKYGKNDQRVTPEPLMRKHKTGSAKHGGIVQIAHQRLAVWLVADFEALSYQGTTTFDTGCAAQICTAPAINYTACCQQFFIFSI